VIPSIHYFSVLERVDRSAGEPIGRKSARVGAGAEIGVPQYFRRMILDVYFGDCVGALVPA
jgi:hypothetical protein